MCVTKTAEPPFRYYFNQHKINIFIVIWCRAKMYSSFPFQVLLFNDHISLNVHHPSGSMHNIHLFNTVLGSYWTTTLALQFGFDTWTIPSPCSTIKTQQPSLCTTSTTVRQMSNSPLSSKRTVQSLSWTFSSNDTIKLFQHLFTERRPLRACTQNGTP